MNQRGNLPGAKRTAYPSTSNQASTCRVTVNSTATSRTNGPFHAPAVTTRWPASNTARAVRTLTPSRAHSQSRIASFVCSAAPCLRACRACAAIALSKPSGGKRADNYLKLKGDAAGKITFDARAELKFLPLDDCPHDKFSLTIDGTDVDASYRGYCCVLPEPFSLGYSAGQPCPLSGSAFGFTITFGAPNCTGVSQSGVCILGNCP